MTAATEFGRPRVLVVEDEPLLREMLVEALMEQGFEVYVAATAWEAITQLTHGKCCDLLFTDINLGQGDDGVTLSWAARKLMPELPVIYTSGAVDGLRQVEAVAGATFMRKPYDTMAVGAFIRAAVEPRTLTSV
jgi:DNA-binding NtrC family response regulator